jgi:hypothetical protein
MVRGEAVVGGMGDEGRHVVDDERSRVVPERAGEGGERAGEAEREHAGEGEGQLRAPPGEQPGHRGAGSDDEEHGVGDDDDHGVHGRRP